MLRNIRLLYIHNFLSDFWPQWPFVVIYFANISGSYTAAMSIMATETLAAALFDIPTGIFSDRIGRRMTMACGSLACTLAITCYAFAHGILLLYIGAVLWGLGVCLFSGNNNALLYETLQSAGLEKEYHHYRGKTGSMYQLALCTSAFLSIWLSHFGLQTIFMVAIIPQALAVLISLLFTEPRQHQITNNKGLNIFTQACVKTWRNPHLLLLVTAKAISYGAGESKFKFQSAFVNSVWPIWAVGLYRGINHGLSFCGFRLSGWLIEKFKEPIIFISRDLYWFMSGITAVTLNNAFSPIMFISGAIFFGPGEVASDHLMQKEFTDDERATMGSISSFITSIAFAIVAIAIGLISDRFGLRAGLAVGIATGFLSLPVNAWLFRKSFGLNKPSS